MKDFIGQQIDRYRITERLGMGGMAVVYKAYDTRLERDVAIKVIRSEAIPPEQYSKLMKRFEREAKAQASFNHRHIVPVYDYGEVDGSPYLVMAYVSGSTLKEKTGQPVDYRQAIAWLLPVAEALGYAHKRGVVHRDIKPSNILFDEEGQPVLTDFGIAKVLETDEATLTGTGLGVGTPEYMAPEQWQGKTSEATDQYALGVVLYELLTGQKPYSADTPAAIILMQATEPLRSPRKLAPDIPEEVEKLLYKSLARDPQDRFESLAGFQKALEQLQVKQFIEHGRSAEVRQAIQSDNNKQFIAGLMAESETIDDIAIKPVIAVTGGAKPTKKRDKNLPGWQPTSVRNWTLWVVGVILIVSLLATTIILWVRGRSDNSESTVAIHTMETEALQLTDMNLDSLESTQTTALTKPMILTSTPTQEISPVIVSTMVNPMDGVVMVYVPEGEFLMGSEDGQVNEKPEHTVYLDGYWIYQTEVTNEQYRICVEEKYCSEPTNTFAYESQEYQSHPVVYINWFFAKEYCDWAGGRLPTEAEWEKAARGTDGRKYPWGNQPPNCNLANYKGCIGSTAPVGSYPNDVSPYGAFDMAGNVFEWVADFYDKNYYNVSESKNPQGPTIGGDRVLRGGSYWAGEEYLRVSFREGDYPRNSFDGDGFRCVLGEAP